MSKPGRRFILYKPLKTPKGSNTDFIMRLKVDLSSDERRELETRSVGGFSQEDKELLIRSHLALIFRCVSEWRKWCPRVDVADLLLEGISYVYDSIDRYDVTRGRFTTFVVMVLSSRRMRFVGEHWHAAGIRMPEALFQIISKMFRYDPNWEESIESSIAAAKSAAVSLVPAVAVQSLYTNHVDAIHLLQRSNQDKEDSDRQIVVIDRATPRDPEMLDKIKTIFLSRLDSVPLTISERSTFLARFNGDQLQTVGDRLGVSRERARQLETSAIAKIKKSDLFKDVEDLWEFYAYRDSKAERSVAGESCIPSMRRRPTHSLAAVKAMAKEAA